MARKIRQKSKPVRQQVVVDHLRRLITDGGIAPGGRLPTHDEIKQKFHTTDMTVQRAFDRLTADGFIRTVPKIGRFVADRLPHLTRYGLVFASRPEEGGSPQWSRFDEAIVEASRSVAAQNKISFAIYHNINGHLDSEGYQTLMRDIEAQRLAGVCFAFIPFELQATELLERPDPPRVNQQDKPDAVTRGPDERHFMYRAIDHLIADGRRRFAVITKPMANSGYPDEFEAAIASRGAITHPFWTQAVEPNQTRWVRHAVHAILNTRVTRLPDALLVTDDHLVEAVSEALVEFGIRVPEEMRVIGHWNFPLPYRGRVPIDLLGFDAREMLRMWVEAIDAQRRGERIPPLRTVPARFSWELLREETKAYTVGEPTAIRSIS